MKKYIISICVIAIILCSVVAQESEGQKINLLIEAYSLTTDKDTHMRDLIKNYLKSDKVNPAVVSAKLMSALSDSDPRKFRNSKQTIFNSMLYDFLSEAIENNEEAEVSLTPEELEELEKASQSLLRSSDDTLLLEKAVQLIGTIAKDKDADFQHTFALNVLHMLRRIIAKSDKYSSASLIARTVPHITKIMNKKIATDPRFTSLLFLLYENVTYFDAENALQDLFDSAVNAAIS